MVHHRAYHIWYMVKTTVYLDPEIVVTLRRLSQQEGRSQAELIREALTEFTRQRKRPPIPGVGEFDSGESTVSGRAGKILREASLHGKWRKQRSRGADR
jgi:hypothetical protein